MKDAVVTIKVEGGPHNSNYTRFENSNGLAQVLESIVVRDGHIARIHVDDGTMLTVTPLDRYGTKKGTDHEQVENEEKPTSNVTIQVADPPSTTIIVPLPFERE